MYTTEVFVVCIFACASAKIGFGPGQQEWGFVEVRPGAHIFWWLYYTTANVQNYTERPLIIWLQGGPGASSTGFGNFAELGPLDENSEERNSTWVKNANVLFVDCPVGAGFSYGEQIFNYAVTNKQIAEDMLQFLKSFYKKNPQFKTVPLYILSESYGGKMAIEISLVLNKEIKNGKIQSNFKGVGLGNSWISPTLSVLAWADFLYNTGIVDQEGRQEISAKAQKIKEATDKHQYARAIDLWAETEYLIMSVTYNVDFYNILQKIPTEKIRSIKSTNSSHIRPFHLPSVGTIDKKLNKLMNGPVKKALGLNKEWGKTTFLTFTLLEAEFMKPVTEIVEMVLNETDLKVVVYSGQLDLIVATTGTVEWVDELKWSVANKWKNVKRRALDVNGIVEGYVKTLGNFSMYWINRAGHMVPRDNPVAMEQVLKDLTDNFRGAI